MAASPGRDPPGYAYPLRHPIAARLQPPINGQSRTKKSNNIVAFPLRQPSGTLASHFTERDANRPGVLDHVAEVFHLKPELRIGNLILRGLLHRQHGGAGQFDGPAHGFSVNLEVAAVDDCACV